MALLAGFEINEVPKEEIEEAWHLLEVAYAKDEVWTCVFQDVKNPEEIHPWIMENIVPRWNMPDIKTYQVKDLSNGRMAAWTALEYPWKYVPEMTEELKGHALDESHMPPALEGMNMDALIEFFISLTDSKNHGWNPEEDYRTPSYSTHSNPNIDILKKQEVSNIIPDRKGTMVHPDYQKKGFGTALTRYCNAISDKSGDCTWVPARPTSIKMFRDNGFKDIGEVDSHLERWGGLREKSITYTTLRTPPSVATEA